jgi:uroporphyrinogen-III synthase
MTRPKAPGQRFATALRSAMNRPLRITFSPLLHPTFVPFRLPDIACAAVIFTSETAVLAAKDQTGLPSLAYCVGDRTALVARRAGFTTRSAAGDADALVQLILQDHTVGPLLHLRGKDQRGDVADKLNAAGIQTLSIITYFQHAAPLSPAAWRVLTAPHPLIVPLFSPRTAQIFAEQVAGLAICPLFVATISTATAQNLGNIPLTAQQSAATPDAAAMIAAIIRLADTIPVA